MTTHWKRNSSLYVAFILIATLLIVLFILDNNRSDFVGQQEVVHNHNVDVTEVETTKQTNDSGNASEKSVSVVCIE